MKFAFIAKQRGIWPADWLCGALGVSRGGFYAWLTRPRSNRSRSNEELGAKVRASFITSDRTYGARRVWHDMLAEGISCGLHRIERLMRLQALKARPRRCRLPPDLGERQVAAVAANVLNRSFAADALVMAIWRRGKPDALLHHSDRGGQYTSEQFQKLTADHGVICSMPFSKLRAYLRKAAERTIPRLRRRIGRFARTLTTREASNYFRHRLCVKSTGNLL